MNWNSSSVLVTGASAGIGQALARAFAPEVSRIILIARRLNRLEALRTELLQHFPSLQVECLAADLGTEAGIEKLIQEINSSGWDIDILVNNAGLGDIGTFRTAPWSRIQPMLEVNIRSLTRLTHAFAPAMVSRKRGAILNISSSASFLPIPSTAVYAATKAYVTSFSEALRAELLAHRIHVTALCPGPIPTEFADVAARPDGKREFRSPGWLAITPEQAAREALVGLKSNRPLVIPGLGMKIVATALRLTPRWALRFLFQLGAAKM